MTNDLLEKIQRLVEQNRNLKNENTTLKAQSEAKEAELNRLNDRLLEQEQQLQAIAQTIDGALAGDSLFD
jgi:hypothetical protein